MNFLSNKYFQFILRIVLGGLFIYAALPKIFDPQAFAKAVGNYEMLPVWLAHLAAMVIPYIEFFAGTFLIIGKFKKEAALIISAMLVAFLIALVSALSRGLNIACGCFSLDNAGSTSDIVLRIIEDVLMLSGALIILIFDRNIKLRNNKEIQTI
ncbi:MAG TPA: MauE/DoxX family redox-associated membrane protein [Ignavibacteria bacterium]|nr:MauE/DoxX family redox-associated membrane protein [Ignavibacteria bacterium]